MSDAIQAEGLVKRYGTTTALAGVDLAAPTGTILGVLGPNGAGKTTAVRILATLSRPAAKARAAELLERFGLSEAAGRAAKTYSGGMRRRLDLAASLVGRPQVLYLDEPRMRLGVSSRR